MDHEPKNMDEQESNNWNEHQSNNWELNEQEQDNWEPNYWESNEEPTNWEPNEHEPNNWEPNEQQPSDWGLNQQEPNEQPTYNWGEIEPINWDEQESNDWDEQELDNIDEQESNDWDEQEPDNIDEQESKEWDEEEPGYYNEWDETFNDIYRCYPLSAIDKSNLENGGKVIMPHSALSLLAYMDIVYPMLFELKNPSTEKVTHCGVQEFTADWGKIYVPKWMMENIDLKEGNHVKLRSIQVPRGTYLKLQPHTKDFLEISNPKAILEFSLRDYFCLTTGDTIVIAYNNKQYYIDIVETKPSHAVNTIETDCEVDFLQPLDYIEPQKQLLPTNSSDMGCSEVHGDSVKFIPFNGIARRLDGKPCTQSISKEETENETKDLKFKSASQRIHVNVPKIQTSTKASMENTTEESAKKKEEPKFQAFIGKKYSLMD